jgi:hypothetical protein
MMGKNEYDDGEAVKIEKTANGGSLPVTPLTAFVATRKCPDKKRRNLYA